MPLPALAVAGLAAGAAGGGFMAFGRKKKSGGGGSYDPSMYYDRGGGNKVDPHAVRQVYLDVLGREPNQREVVQFQKYVESGDLGYQDIAEIVGGLPEAQNQMLQTQTT